MKKIFLVLIFVAFNIANAHFLTFMSSTDNVSKKEESKLDFDVMFIHPFEQNGMTLEI